MDTAQESICCKEIDKIQSLLIAGDPSPTCITTHSEFLNACLSRTVLTIAWREYTTTEPCRDVNMAIVDMATLLIFVVVSQTSTGRL